MRVTSGDHPDGVFWTKSGQFGPSDDDHFRGQKAILSSILGLKKACLLMKWPFGLFPKVNVKIMAKFLLFGENQKCF